MAWLLHLLASAQYRASLLITAVHARFPIGLLPVIIMPLRYIILMITIVVITIIVIIVSSYNSACNNTCDRACNSVSVTRA